MAGSERSEPSTDEVEALRALAANLAAEIASLREDVEQEQRTHARALAELSQLLDEALEEARLDGARKTARRVTHELRNMLSPVAGYGELLESRVEGENAELARRLKVAALRAAEILARLDNIARFRETQFGGEPMLDLDAAVEPDAGPQLL